MNVTFNMPHWRWLGSVMVLLLAAGHSLAGVYMKFEDVPGEVADGRFAGWSEVVGVAQRVVRPVDVSVPPVPTSATFGCVISKRIDKMTPLLVKRCGEGLVLPRVVLAYAEGGAVVYRVVLEGVLVSSVNQSLGGREGDQPLEEVSFNFTKASWSAIEVGGGDEVAGGVTTRFDLAAGTGTQKSRLAFRAEVETETVPGQLRLRCPVEQGQKYRLAMTGDFKGDWVTILEFTAEEDGIVEKIVRDVPPVVFLRFEEVE